MFFASSDVNWTSVKVSLQQWDLPLTINISLNGCEYEIHGKTLAQDVFERRWSLDGVKTLIKMSMWDFTLSGGWALCCRPQPEHKSWLSLSPLNVWTIKTLSSVRKYLQKVVCFILISSRAFNKYWSPTVNLIAVKSFTDVQLILLLAKNI